MDLGSQLAGGWWACEMGRGCEMVLGQKMGSQGLGCSCRGELVGVGIGGQLRSCYCCSYQ